MNEQPKTYIYPKLAQTGLANMLFVWAKAIVVNQTLNANIIGPSWTQPFRIGPWLRRERDKRYYLSDFSNDGYINGVRKAALLLTKKKVYESEASQALAKNQILVVENGTFHPLIGHESLIKSELYRIIDHRVRNRVTQRTENQNYIGVHIRRGDFKLIDQAIPIEWYIKAVHNLNAILPKPLPVRIFSDAGIDELAELADLDGAELMPKAPAIEDLLVLSESQIIIGTSLSTFSLWASFINRRLTIWSPKSPGVYGYGLKEDHHIQTDWDGLVTPAGRTLIEDLIVNET